MSKEFNVNVNATQAHSLLTAFEKLTTNRSHNRGTINVNVSKSGGVSRLECVNHHFWPWNSNSTKISKDMVANLRNALHQVVSEELTPQFEVMLKNAAPEQREKLREKIESVLDAFARAINKGDGEGEGKALSRAEIAKIVGNVKQLRGMTSVDALLEVSDKDLARMASRKSMTKETQALPHQKDRSYKANEAAAKAFGQAKALIGNSLFSGESVREFGRAIFDKIFPKTRNNLKRRASDLVDLAEACNPPEGRNVASADLLAARVQMTIQEDADADWIEDKSQKNGRVLNKDLGERAAACHKTFVDSEKGPEDIERFFNDMTAIVEEQKTTPRKELTELRETLEKAGLGNLEVDDQGCLVSATKADIIKLLNEFSIQGGGDAGVGELFEDQSRTELLEGIVRDLQAKLGALAPQKEDSEGVQGADEVSEPAGTLSQEDVEFRRTIDSKLNKIYLTSTDLKSLLSSAGERIMAVIAPDVNEIRAEENGETRRSRLAEVNKKMQQRYPSLAFEDGGKDGVRLTAAKGQGLQAVLADVKAMFRDFATGDFPYAEFGGREVDRDIATKFVDAFVYDVSGARPHYADGLRTDYAFDRELHLDNSPDYTANGRFDLKRLEADIKANCRGKHFRETFAYAIDRFTKKYEKIVLSDPVALGNYVESLRALKAMFNSGVDTERTAKALCDKVITNIEARTEIETRDAWGDKENVQWRVTSDSLEEEVKNVLRLVSDLYGKNTRLP